MSGLLICCRKANPLTLGLQHARAPEPAADAHGRAALTLVESLIHELADQSILTTGQAVTVFEVACDAQSATAEEGPNPGGAAEAVDLLCGLMSSFKKDL